MTKKLRVKIGDMVEYVRFNESTTIRIRENEVFFSTAGWPGLSIDKEPSEQVDISFVSLD